jgi:hypothetical protein
VPDARFGSAVQRFTVRFAVRRLQGSIRDRR